MESYGWYSESHLWPFTQILQKLYAVMFKQRYFKMLLSYHQFLLERDVEVEQSYLGLGICGSLTFDGRLLNDGCGHGGESAIRAEHVAVNTRSMERNSTSVLYVLLE